MTRPQQPISGCRGRILFATWAVFALGLAGGVRAQETGEITGTVVDSTTSKPLPFANVVVLETTLGANAQMDGSFRVRSVPAGTYDLRASYLGYEAVVRSVTVVAGSTVTMQFALRKKVAAGTTKKIVVLDTRPLVDVAEISTVRTTTAEEISKLTVDAVADVVQRQVGVAGEGDELHIRGGRVDETQFRIEGVAMKNVVTGAPVGGTLSAKAVQELQVITGGYQAEYGQAISGVVEVELKEPGQAWRSAVEYQSGSFGTERLFLQTEGREPITGSLLPKIGLRVPGTVSILVGLDMLATDTYLPSSRHATDLLNGVPQRRTLRSRYEVSFFGIGFNYDDFLRLRQENGLTAYTKISWKPSARHKVNFTFTKFGGEDHGFNRYRTGDESLDAGSTNTRYRWEFNQQLDQYLTFAEDTNAQSINWKYAISNNAYSTVTLSRFYTDERQAVQGKRWDQYLPWRNTDPNQYFVTDANGDYPFYQDVFTERWNLDGNYTRRWHQHHEFKAGAEASYYTLQMINIRNPAEGEGGLGSVRDLYRVNPNEGSFFAQNQFKYEGFVGHVGLRGDYMFLGKQADDAVAERRNGMTESVAQAYLDHTHELFGYRYKLFWSPRLGINHPITDRDEMHFNFGHFVQWPRRTYYFAKIGSQSSEAFPLVGNLDLDPQRSVQYEFGVKHQFTDHDLFDITFFNKDVYGYPVATRPIEAQARRTVYVNDDFSRTRGLELVVRHQAIKRIGGQVSYEYQIATGKPADPNRIKQVDPDALETGNAEPELTEEFMPWNRPHRLQINFDYRIRPGDHPRLFGWTMPDRWGVNLFYKLSSGRPYTPVTIRSEKIGKRNSKNAPLEHELDAKLNKTWGLRGNSTFGISIEARNLFNVRILRVVDANTGEAPQVGRGTYTVLPASTSEEKLADQLSNPAFYAEGRNIRVGLEVGF